MQIIEIASLTSSNESFTQGLISLLMTCVEHGASIGFMLPFTESEAVQYWDSVGSDMKKGGRRLLIATQDEQIIGTVQLSLSDKKNGLHRAEIEKLMVHPDARKQGIANVLMHQIEAVAQELARSLLILDTQTNSLAYKLYLKRGYRRVGDIPGFAFSIDGELEATCIFYKHVPDDIQEAK
ncbi:GNAT family N-acetyltransferase [Shewanella sp. D64]|uniref:GNAT family N-acetyltransferase n=1 Tax=unclassified Shewanella TaxID=196818 RepID=UPI0022BA549F|nr:MULTISPECIES: GNAT family N-acetyltransferase [unclassified Shewanella]MEC4724479.1 GNAT family N-acetyltransferase [Shewanella sp. D64]MEC4736744.1 GNAT family N-acetyltransferase [Shewanella sp. E94]WBJ94590.1 GNAT family N-acetyltransferase [Shewanella sp. MTB7]